VLLEALPYIREFAGATIVIKYGGAAMTAPELKTSFARDVALLRLVGMRPVVVHGGGPDISRYSERLDLPVRFEQGLRVTDEPTMELVKMVLVGKVNKEIVAQLQVAGVGAVGLAGDDGGLIAAAKADAPADLGFVGRVEEIRPEVLEHLGSFVPVIASVGVDAAGQSYNINADTVAGAIAEALQAEKLVYLTDIEGLRRDVGDAASLIRQTTADELEQLVEAGIIAGGMIPKVASCIHAVRNGVHNAHILDGRIAHVLLLEIFTDSGIGTMIKGEP
jgi:acetylglutamate kinase